MSSKIETKKILMSHRTAENPILMGISSYQHVTHQVLYLITNSKDLDAHFPISCCCGVSRTLLRNLFSGTNRSLSRSVFTPIVLFPHVNQDAWVLKGFSQASLGFHRSLVTIVNHFLDGFLVSQTGGKINIVGRRCGVCVRGRDNRKRFWNEKL